jgi:palmitoyltransferase ZDHHC4
MMDSRGQQRTPLANLCQIFFLVLLVGSQYLALPTAWPLVSTLHRGLLLLTILPTYALLYLSAYSDPGTVTAENLGHHLSLYPYDFTLFHPGQLCRTCQLPKPARSKHCSVCKACVAKADHHCIFINNCVGRGNQHWFLLLLLFTGLQTFYGGCLGASLIADKMRARNPAFAFLWWRSPLSLHDWLVLWSWGLQDRVRLGAVSMLAILVSPLVWGLLAYNLWLVYCGTTTNESMKWSDLQYEMSEGVVFRRRLPLSRPKDPRWEAMWTRWPVESEQILVQTENGAVPPTDREWPPGEGEWERVWKLKDVENLYDLGLGDNLVDIFVPGHEFRDPEDAEEDVEIRGRRGRRDDLSA